MMEHLQAFKMYLGCYNYETFKGTLNLKMYLGCYNSLTIHRERQFFDIDILSTATYH